MEVLTFVGDITDATCMLFSMRGAVSALRGSCKSLE